MQVFNKFIRGLSRMHSTIDSRERSLLLPTVVLAIVFHLVAAQCVDLVQDCGGKADNHTDNAQAFSVCQHLASQRSGCITVPAGLFRTSPVVLNTSHTEFRISNDAVLLPWVGMKPAGALFFVGGRLNPTSAEYAENISIHGEVPGHFTVDLSTALYTPWRVRAFIFRGSIKKFLLANMMCRDSNPQRSNHTTYPSSMACIGVSFDKFNDVRLNPQDGILHNLSCTGCVFGYGLITLLTGERISVKNVYSEGGVTLRMETDQITGFLNEVEAENITCRNGHAAVVSSPHVQRNGVFHVRDVISYSCNVALAVGSGYTQEGYPPGYFSNSSTISNVVAYYGTHSQNSSKDIDVPACTLCAHSYNLPMNYIVTLTNTTTIGFPRPSNRTECVPYAYWKGCPWNM